MRRDVLLQHVPAIAQHDDEVVKDRVLNNQRNAIGISLADTGWSRKDPWMRSLCALTRCYFTLISYYMQKEGRRRLTALIHPKRMKSAN